MSGMLIVLMKMYLYRFVHFTDGNVTAKSLNELSPLPTTETEIALGLCVAVKILPVASSSLSLQGRDVTFPSSAPPDQCGPFRAPGALGLPHHQQTQGGP